MSDRAPKWSVRRVFSLPASRRTAAREIDDELRFHLESRVAELCAGGLSSEAARRQAEREYGDLDASRRELEQVDRRRLSRIEWSTRLDALRLDTRHALRGLRNESGFTVAVVIVLALGIGANATMFGVIDRLLLDPPPHVLAPERLTTPSYVRNFKGEADYQDVQSYAQYLDLTHTADVYAGVAAYSSTYLTLGLGAEARRLNGMRVTASYFPTLGVKPQLGRFFLPEEDGSPVAPNVAILSYGYWQREYDGDASVLGRVIRLADGPYTIVGVAPRYFSGVDRAGVDMWVPLTARVTPADVAGWSESRNSFWLRTVVRIRDGVSPDRAADATTRVMRAAMRQTGVAEATMAAQAPRVALRPVLPWQAHGAEADARVALLLGAVSLLVLFVACANVTNLQLARGIRRRREVAVRVALGVSRARQMQRLVVEGVALAMLGGAAALAVTQLGSVVVRRLALASMSWGDAPLVDRRVLAYTALVALATALLTGFAPALQAGRTDINAVLSQGSRRASTRHSPARSGLLFLQASLSVVLLVGAGLFIRSLAHINALPLGFEPGRVLVAHVDLDATRSDVERDAVYRRLLNAAVATPGVDGAALTTALPFWDSWAMRLRLPGGDTLPRVRDGGPYFYAVTPAFFHTLGIHLVSGRLFNDGDQASPVVIVNESLARLAWPNSRAVGKCLQVGADTTPCAEVIGVVSNARRQRLIEDTSIQFFIPLAQTPAWLKARDVVIRASGDAAALAEPVRRRLQAAVPGLPYVSVQPMQELLNPQSRSWRMGARMFAAFGGLALVLALVGLYSLLAYDVSQRSHEIGVRMALGAMRRDVARMIVGTSMRLMTIGVAAGVAIALAAGRFVQPLLFDTSPRDPAVFVTVVASMLGVAMLAAIVPMRRAWAVDPVVAMKAD